MMRMIEGRVSARQRTRSRWTAHRSSSPNRATARSRASGSSTRNRRSCPTSRSPRTSSSATCRARGRLSGLAHARAADGAVLADFGMQRDLSPGPAVRGARPGAAADDRDHARRSGRRSAHRLRRTDIVADRRRGAAAVRGDPRLRADGVSIVYISHRLNEIIDLADRIVVLRDGRLVDDSPAAGATEEGIAQLMVGRDLSDLFPRGTGPTASASS